MADILSTKETGEKRFKEKEGLKNFKRKHDIKQSNSGYELLVCLVQRMVKKNENTKLQKNKKKNTQKRNLDQ